jgi:hypothetical protein
MNFTDTVRAIQINGKRVPDEWESGGTYCSPLIGPVSSGKECHIFRQIKADEVIMVFLDHCIDNTG